MTAREKSRVVGSRYLTQPPSAQLTLCSHTVAKPEPGVAGKLIRGRAKETLTMNLDTLQTPHNLYLRSITASKKVRWEIDRDVLRGRTLTREQKHLPDGLSLVSTLGFL